VSRTRAATIDRVTCYESNEQVLTQIYDPNGNALTMGEIVCIINEQAEEIRELRDKDRIIATERATPATLRNDPFESLEYQSFEEEQAKHCRCTHNRPCEGVLAGGPCDEWIDDEDEDDYDDEWWEDDEGEEWNTWPMMPVHPVQDEEDDE
jgi:hypothetical protein